MFCHVETPFSYQDVVCSKCFAVAYKYFCQNFGDHSTASVGSHNWNEEAVHKMASDLITPWQNLKSTTERRFERDIESIETLMDHVIGYIGKFR